MLKNFLYFSLGIFLLGFGHPAMIPELCPIASAIGLVPFFLLISRVSKKFISGLLFFFTVQAIQLSWLVTLKYHGYPIIAAYFILCVLIGIQGGIFANCIPKKEDITFITLLFLSSLWALMEWSRLFFFSGFAWNQLGLSLTYHYYPAQLLSIGGIYFLTFLVMFTSGIFFMAIAKKSKTLVVVGCAMVFLPIFFGAIRIRFTPTSSKEKIHVALVQTGLEIEQRSFMHEWPDKFVHPLIQWQKIFKQLKSSRNLDVIALPESALPFSMDMCVYAYKDLIYVLNQVYKDEDIELSFPPLIEPEAKKGNDNQWYVSNSYIAQLLSNIYHCDLIIGLDSEDKNQSFNSAVFFSPKSNRVIYNKQKLIPIAEYLPFKALEKIAERYDIFGFFQEGRVPVIFQGKYRYAPSVCYDECFPNLIRKFRKLNPDVLVNISNDAWFPKSNLMASHFVHGRIRSIELGLPLLRACNSGVTVAMDAFGREKSRLPLIINGEIYQGCLIEDVPIFKLNTLYTHLGDAFFLSISFLSFFLYGISSLKNQNSSC